ncbi:MAG TPA: tRNA uridine-5-carboxymethylaminomethyl(34) synthesis GTPase MnmE [Anaerolineae bacterium]|nr:tRNA uridine-5-carboxymethylaminomethyl(34) synthesis GTPase MnmE [Anaerolineae bacterium]
MTERARYSPDDTIAAIATPVGSGGIGIVRLSGPEARSILECIFRPARPLVPLQLTYGHIVDPQQAQTVDEVLVAYMPAPRTYTRQDIVEIDCHGGPVPLRRVLELCFIHGARAAGPGEFTLRAFLNGRIDLAQAEAVADVVAAKTEAGLRMAVAQLDGRLSDQIQAIRARLLDALAWVEASIDFEPDEVPAYEIDPDLHAAQEALAGLLSGAERGVVYREGIRTAIVGQPNVGKSSLLNALLRAERAIVTPIPGTTRDTLEETLNLHGIPLVLVDTAGIRADTRDMAEDMGVERSRAALARADLALLVIDANQPVDGGDRAIAALIAGRPAIAVLNKTDLPVRANVEDLLPGAPVVEISALTGAGIAALEGAIEEAIFGGRVVAAEPALVSSSRHRDVLRRAQESVQAAIEARANGLPLDFVSIGLRGAVHMLGEVTGESVSDTLLETIFSRFCIGK